MAEYIERDAAIAALKTLVNVTRKYADGDPEAVEMFISGIYTSIGVLLVDDAIPRIADEEPPAKETGYRCSNCGREIEDYIYGCPYCGVQME